MDKDLYDFITFESKEKLFARTYKNVNYWQYIRYDILRAVCFKEVGRLGNSPQNNDQKGQKIQRRIGTLLKQCGEDAKSVMLLKPRDLLYFDEQIYRYVDGQLVDSCFDYLEFEEKFSVQRCYHHEKGDKKTKCTGIGVSGATLMQGILYRLTKITPCVFTDTQEDKYIVSLCNKIRIKFNMDIHADKVIQKVKDGVLHHKIYGRYYEWVIKRVRPKAIIVVTHFDSKLLPLYGVAHKYHIPVIELEHGLITNHGAYNYKDLTAEGKQLPDYVFTYGDFWTQYIQLPICMKPIAVGNAFLESQKRKYRDIEPDEKTIVFYSGRIGIEQAEFVIDFYKRNAGKGYRVCFKPHPREYSDIQELYPIFGLYPEIRIVPKETDLYELLAGAKHHVAAASTVLFESAIFDVKRYVMYMPEWIQYIQPLIDIGLAKMFRNLEELQTLLEEDEDTDKSMLDFIWKSNAKQNALETLENIISGREID